MKKVREVPSFLIELPHSISHIILKRRYLLRNQKSEGVNPLRKDGSSSWLKTAIAPVSLSEPGETWNNAHTLSEKFQLEIGQHVYVEPASKVGIYASLFGDSQTEEPEAEPSSNDLQPRTHFGVGSTVKSNIGLGGGGLSFNPASPSMSAMSFLPAQAQQAIKDQTAQSKDVRCPMLYTLSGWMELSEVKRKMFETECAQVIKSGMNNHDTPVGEYSTLALVAIQSSTSRALKSFLHQALKPTE